MSDRPLGRRPPPDFVHIQKYGLALPTPATVERVLALPPYRVQYDQGREGACVGYGSSWAMSMYHRGAGRSFPRFDPRWLWNEAKIVDDFPETNPGDDNGTTVRAAFDVLRAQGDRRIVRRVDGPPDLQYGVKANRWATSTDDVRAAIASGRPVVVGMNWYRDFDSPEKVGSEWWIGRGDLGSIRGGHCVSIYGASDKRQAVKMVNNWGPSYPLVFLPYDVLQRLLNEDGEAAVIADS